MAKKLTELFKEAIAKASTEEGRRELREEHERMEVEALQAAQEVAQATPAAPEAAVEVQEGSDGTQGALGSDTEAVRVRALTRTDPILPVVTTVREDPTRTVGRLAFGGIIEAGDVSDVQLPLLPAPEGPRVPLLELMDQHGVPTMLRGRGAPLELAVFVAACILTPHHVRETEGRITTTVRELRDFLFGPTWRPGPTGNRPGDWARVREALLRADGLWLPLQNGNWWRAFAIREMPGSEVTPDLLDRLIRIHIELPEGSASGPIIDARQLARLRRVSGPKFRAYIAAHSVAWRPGVTRHPHPHNRSFHIWSSDPALYPILTRETRRRLAFGVADKTKHRTRAEQDAAWEDLPGVKILTREASAPDGQEGWVIVPAEAAAAINRQAE